MCLQSHLVDGLTAKKPDACVVPDRWMFWQLRHTSVNNYLLTIRVKSCWGGKVNNRASDFLGARMCMLGFVIKYWRDPHVPALSAGMGTIDFPTPLTISVPSMASRVISDGKTPGAIAFTVLG